jgi:hypothetical protein
VTYDLHEESAVHCTLQAATLLMLAGVEIGLALLDGPVGAAPQVLARLWAGAAPLLGPVELEGPVEPVLPVFPVAPDEVEPVAKP